jgi:hypothetical protein
MPHRGREFRGYENLEYTGASYSSFEYTGVSYFSSRTTF